MQPSRGPDAKLSDDPFGESPDERSEARMRTVVNVRAIFNNGQSKVDCQIHKVTKTGAKLTLNASIALPGTFLLEIPSRHTSYKAEIIWRRHNTFGIRLSSLAAKNTDGDQDTMRHRIERLTAENADLRRCIVDLAARLAEREAGRPVCSSDGIA